MGEEKMAAMLLGDSKSKNNGFASASSSSSSSTSTGVNNNATTAVDKNGKPIKNGTGDKKKAGGEDEEEEEEKFEKLSPEKRDKEHIRLMRRLATMMEPMKADFLVCKLKHTCSRCHEYILNGIRYKCER